MPVILNFRVKEYCLKVNWRLYVMSEELVRVNSLL